MPFNQKGKLRYYQFSIFDPYPLTQGIFTRHGGVSPHPWKTLNIGGTVGDEPARVAENKSRLLSAAREQEDDLFEIWQVHQAKVLFADEPRSPEMDIPKADAVITDNPRVTLLMRFADCVPLYLFDPINRAIGLAHAGWKGTVLHIARKTVQAMEQQFGSDPEEILAGIGPSIGPDHYRIQEDVIHKVIEAYPDDYHLFLSTEKGITTFDLWTANRNDLEQSGVEQVDIAEICTACEVEDWYSHREEGKTGRFGALFSL